MYLFQGLTVLSFLLLGNLDPDLERDLDLVRWPMLYKLLSVFLLLLYTLRVVDNREEDHSFLLGNILSIYQSSMNPRSPQQSAFTVELWTRFFWSIDHSQPWISNLSMWYRANLKLSMWAVSIRSDSMYDYDWTSASRLLQKSKGSKLSRSRWLDLALLP